MRRRALLAILVALLVIGAYGVYVVSYPKYPEVKGCVNPFAVTRPVGKVQENWSKVHVFFKLATSRDFWKLAKPWQVDYSHVKVVKHTIDYNGEKITMLAMGIPLKDKKHVIVLYEFSKPVQGVKVRGYLFEVPETNTKDKTIKTVAITTNGVYTPTNSCPHECNSDSDCPITYHCNEYCCNVDWTKAIHCCWGCVFACANPVTCVLCIETVCPWCVEDNCLQWGSECEGGWVPGP
ncbi:hypothetical protein [Thermococcus sp.]|uniref:hypothetical protein n=1 Tax=Thermococcus sp. TaxID=35749 RepID=UPI00263592CE|nr:hypothetical protein [Thermococcus sp.]